MLYTVAQPEEVTGEWIAKESFAPRCERRLGTNVIEGVKTQEGIVLTRLISTDPRMYLDERYQPGRIIPDGESGRD